MAEGTRQRQAFDLYWQLGAERSIERLRQQLAARGRARSLRTLYEWSRSCHWQWRLEELERAARQAQDQAHIAALREMCERQAKEGLLLQQKGAEWLMELPSQAASPEAAIRAVVEGARLERLARGEPGERSQEVKSHEEPDPRFAELSDAQLERLAVAGALAGAAAAPPA